MKKSTTPRAKSKSSARVSNCSRRETGNSIPKSFRKSQKSKRNSRVDDFESNPRKNTPEVSKTIHRMQRVIEKQEDIISKLYSKMSDHNKPRPPKRFHVLSDDEDEPLPPNSYHLRGASNIFKENIPLNQQSIELSRLAQDLQGTQATQPTKRSQLSNGNLRPSMLAQTNSNNLLSGNNPNSTITIPLSRDVSNAMFSESVLAMQQLQQQQHLPGGNRRQTYEDQQNVPSTLTTSRDIIHPQSVNVYSQQLAQTGPVTHGHAFNSNQICYSTFNKSPLPPGGGQEVSSRILPVTTIPPFQTGQSYRRQEESLEALEFLKKKVSEMELKLLDKEKYYEGVILANQKELRAKDEEVERLRKFYNAKLEEKDKQMSAQKSEWLAMYHEMMKEISGLKKDLEILAVTDSRLGTSSGFKFTPLTGEEEFRRLLG